MRYFQIRVPAESSLEVLLDEILRPIWMEMETVLHSNESSSERFARFKDFVTSGMARHIHEFSNCGLAVECHDDIEGGPWVDYKDKIYMLFLPDGFDSFFNEVSKEVLGAVIDGTPLDKKAKELSVLSGKLSRQLGKYVYFNPSCRRIPFCLQAV